MQLGAFSISLAVKDLAKSQSFYEKLGFQRTGGDDHYAILVNGGTMIGLFQGMFENNILTFNPGLENTAESFAAGKPLGSFTDVRELQSQLEAEGMEFADKTDPAGTGIGSFVITDPDGNAILVDQHFPRPE
ncbi:VOC family protein [Paraurantiacibacter namhicola]|uniref:Glyoxalase-like domain protein n=1 Tax=Paraurantiacibacter namhicola TaxID=645517 RepID=A0A1C7DA54_9SPHN|nr:VOC family protein [Paraurantiacibacter namhicola]ANU08334.1 Glyoxalase-like domain protein [Paraurantiacibacter namhicola]